MKGTSFSIAAKRYVQSQLAIYSQTTVGHWQPGTLNEYVGRTWFALKNLQAWGL